MKSTQKEKTENPLKAFLNSITVNFNNADLFSTSKIFYFKNISSAYREGHNPVYCSKA